MSDKIIVDRAKVISVANRITTINKEIDAEFNKLETSIKKLNSAWNSRASNSVIGQFYSIERSLRANRFNIMKDYSTVLHQQVSNGYTSTEGANTSLADSFK